MNKFSRTIILIHGFIIQQVFAQNGPPIEYPSSSLSIKESSYSLLEGLTLKIDPSIELFMKKLDSETPAMRQAERDQLDVEKIRPGLEVTVEDFEENLKKQNFADPHQRHLELLIRFLQNSLKLSDPLHQLTQEETLAIPKAFLDGKITGFTDDKGGIPFIHVLNPETFLLLFNLIARNCSQIQRLAELVEILLRPEVIQGKGFSMEKYPQLGKCLEADFSTPSILILEESCQKAVPIFSDINKKLFEFQKK